MRNIRRIAVVGKLFLILLSTLVANWNSAGWGTLLNDFQTGTSEGWQQGIAPLAVQPNAGPLGAGDFALEVVANGGSSLGSKLVFFNTSAEWTGDYTTQGITTLEGAILNNSGQTLSLRAAVDGLGGRFATTTGFSVPSSSNYQPFTLNLSPGDFTAVGGSDINSTLSSVSVLRLLHNPVPDWRGESILGTFLFDSGPIPPPELHWNQATGTQIYGAPTNWTPNGTPTSADNVFFGTNLPNMDVNVRLIPSPALARDMSFTNGSVQFTPLSGVALINNSGSVSIDDPLASALVDGAQVSTPAQVLWTSAGDAVVGDLGSGTLNLSGGANFNTPTLTIGNTATGAGRVVVTGQGVSNTTTLAIDNDLVIGAAGAGIVDVNNVGTVTAGNDLTIGGDGSQLNIVGPDSLVAVTGAFAIEGLANELNILSGANLTRPQIKANGTLNVMDTGSSLTLESLVVAEGQVAQGEVFITAGGTADIDDLIVTAGPGPVSQASENSGMVTVDGANSTLDTDEIRLGGRGSGSLIITGGATLTSNSTFINSAALSGLAVQNPESTSTLLVDGVGSTADLGLLSMGDNNSSGSILRVTNGGTATSLTGPSAIDANVTFEVDGADSSWTTDLLSGNSTTAISTSNGGKIESTSTIAADQLDITSNGLLTAATSVTVQDSNRDVTISNGGTVAAGTHLSVLHRQVEVSGGDLTAQNSSIAADASVEVSNFGTWTTSGTLAVEGVLEVTSGAEVDAQQVDIVRPFSTPLLSPNGQVTVGPGGRLTSSLTITLGSDSPQQSGSLWLIDGGIATANQALEFREFGSVTLDGGWLRVGSITESVPGGGFFIYNSGTIQLIGLDGYTIGENNGPMEREFGSSVFHLPTGAQFIVDNTLTVPAGTSLTSVGGYTQGGVIHNQGLMVINAGNTSASALETDTELINDGQLVLIDARVQGEVNNASGAINVVGAAIFEDLVHGPGGFFGSGTPTFDGGYSPGSSPAEVAFESGVTFGGGNQLTIELGGLLAGSEFDLLTIDGLATLNGTIQVDLLDGFLPSGGDSFEILTAAGGINGTFQFENLPDLGGLQWNIDYGLNSVVLEVFSPFTADFDLDGDVDADDLNGPIDGWQARYGADLSGNNFLEWQRQLGSGTLIAAASATVPEPSSLLLATLSLLSRSVRRKRT